MKALLRRYAERIDNASLRERVLVFVAATLVLLFLGDALALKPLRDKQRRLSAEISQRQTELRTVQAELQRLARTRDTDPDARNRERLAALRAEAAVLVSQLAEEQRRFTSPQRMREVLGEMLQRNKRLRLLDLKTLPITDLAGAQGHAGRRIFRHGVELTLTGSYLDLHAYLRSLEELSTQLYWARAEMNVTAYPAVSLRLTVYTVSFDKAWLIV
jgi:MSHA biogenesis protein MshJ